MAIWWALEAGIFCTIVLKISFIRVLIACYRYFADKQRYMLSCAGVRKFYFAFTVNVFWKFVYKFASHIFGLSFQRSTLAVIKFKKTQSYLKEHRNIQLTCVKCLRIYF
jgi:hypothetical protein